MQSDRLAITQICSARYPTPLRYAGHSAESIRYRSDDDRVLVSATFNTNEQQPPDGSANFRAIIPGSHDPAKELWADLDDGTWPPPSFERAGPRAQVAYDPARTTAAIITCGGLCPGLNDVIRGLVMSLKHHYGVRRVLGIRYGYHGLVDISAPPIELDTERVAQLHRDGGSFLGSSRGSPSDPDCVHGLKQLGVDLLFVIGGDGSQKGAHAIQSEAIRQGFSISVIGVPKTIDNDIAWVDQTFGFDTAVGIARTAVEGAHVEAKSVRRGIGLVKLMGRASGFIAAEAAMASGNANVVLVPELPFEIEGSEGLLSFLEMRLGSSDHCVIVCAEGAGQKHVAAEGQDASGNKRLGDIGLHLRQRISEHFATIGQPIVMKYFDPSYLIRSAPSNASDSIYCTRLAHNAVHAGMAGKGDMMVGRWYGKFVHIPLPLVAGRRKCLNPSSSLWRAVLEATGQPDFID